jgi:hypothetical protein
MADSIETTADNISDRIYETSLYFMSIAGKRLKKISDVEDLTTYLYSAEYLDDVNGDLRKITKQLNTAHKLNLADMNSLFKNVTAEVYSTGSRMAEHKNTRLSPLASYMNETNPLFRQAVRDYEVMAKSTTVNETYKKTIRQYVSRLTTGDEENAPMAMRKAIKELSEQGISTIDYKSGRSMRMDSAVRRDLMNEYTNIVQDIQNKIAEEIGMDAVEITVEHACAWDHEDVQGRVFLNEEFEKLQNFEVATDIDGVEVQLGAQRQIGQFNCRHMAIPFLVGVSERSFSHEELERVNQRNEDGLEWNGENITIYEATQEQRKLETAMRRERENLNLLKEVRETSPEAERDYQKSKARLAELRNEYHALGDKLKPLAIREKMERSYIPKGSTGNAKLPENKFVAGIEGPNQGREKYERLHISPEIDALSTDKSYTGLEKRIRMTESAESIFKARGMDITKGEPMTIIQAAEGTNPNYDITKKDIVDPYNQNCQRCVAVYTQRRLGFNVEAMPFPGVNEPNQVHSGLESFKLPSGANSFESPEMGKKKLLEEMGKAPDGTLFILSGKETGAPQGHTWCAEKINGKLYFIDPQTNETDVSRYLSKFGQLRYYRADSFVYNSDPSFDWKSVLKAAGK